MEENRKSDNEVNRLINEINYYGYKFKYIDKEKSIEDLHVIEIEKIVAKTNANIHSHSFTDILVTPITIFASLGAAMFILKYQEGESFGLNIFFIFVSVVATLIMIGGMETRRFSSDKSYFKDLLIIYLKYK